MLARHDGQVVLVAGAIPGEEVVARIERVAAGVTYAAIVRPIAPGPDRRPAVDPMCGGNVYAHIAYHRQLQLKADIVADAFRRIAHLPLAAAVRVAGSPERGYRMRARLHVAGRRLGFFREGTHDLCDPAASGQLLDATVATLARLADALARAPLGDLVAVELSENMAGDQRAVQLEGRGNGAVVGRVVRLAEEKRGAERVSRLAEMEHVTALAQIEGITSLTLVVPGRPALVVGQPFVADPLAALIPDAAGPGDGVTLRRHVAAFFQGNRYLLPALVRAVVSRVAGGPVLDLYAGVGLFAVALAASGHARVTAVEGDRVSAADLRENARQLGVVAIESSVEAFLRQPSGERAATAVVDPPRTGLSKESAQLLIHYGVPRIIYVSCDVATLARDVRRLSDGGYRLAGLEAFDVFPNTAHIETVAILDRSG